MEGSIKQDLKLLMEFSNISDEKLKIIAQKTIHDYEKSKKIEKMILEIIYDLGYSKKLPTNHDLDNRYKKITRLVELKGLKTSHDLDIHITNEDIINELYEMSNRETKWIEDHSYLYDGYYDGLEASYTSYELKKGSLEAINEVSNFYQKIILEITPKTKVKSR